MTMISIKILSVKCSLAPALLLFGLISMLTGCAKLFPMQDGAAVKLIIDSIVPSQGAAGQPVLVYGSGFSANPSGNKVYFNGQAAGMDTVASYHVLQVFAPAGGTTGNITLTAYEDASLSPYLELLRLQRDKPVKGELHNDEKVLLLFLKDLAQHKKPRRKHAA